MKLNLGVFAYRVARLGKQGLWRRLRRGVKASRPFTSPTAPAMARKRLKSDAASEFPVRVPIRYGRRSTSRGNTFTMVFSPEYNQRPGTAKIIQCKAAVSSTEDLVLEATELWGAETKKTDQAEFCAKWGCVTLLAPDDFLDQPDRKRRRALLEAWRERVSQNRSYGKLRCPQRRTTGLPDTPAASAPAPPG